MVGAVLVADADVHKQMPLAGVRITAQSGRTVAVSETDNAGLFHLTTPALFRLGNPVSLRFERDGFETASMNGPLENDLLVVRLRPVSRPTGPASMARHTLAHPRVRYSVKTQSFIDVGALVQTFVLDNQGNVPCRGRLPCSPDGEWKAANRTFTVDAAEGNHFRNPRVSCIAGPCPFTRIETEESPQDGRYFKATALTWSDTATFLVEADVVHTQVTDMVREAFPVVFGRGISFTLPPSAAGPSIEAELDGQDTIFPIGPALILSFATCSLKDQTDGSHLYGCELKPDYRFQ